MGGDADIDWTPERARQVGRRLAFIEALLGPRTRVVQGDDYWQGPELEVARPGAEPWRPPIWPGKRWDGELATIIGALLWEVRAGRLPRSRAKPARPLTVEVATFPDAKAAS